jgi:hypothetical protein
MAFGVSPDTPRATQHALRYLSYRERSLSPPEHVPRLCQLFFGIAARRAP